MPGGKAAARRKAAQLMFQWMQSENHGFSLRPFGRKSGCAAFAEIISYYLKKRNEKTVKSVVFSESAPRVPTGKAGEDEKLKNGESR